MRVVVTNVKATSAYKKEGRNFYVGWLAGDLKNLFCEYKGTRICQICSSGMVDKPIQLPIVDLIPRHWPILFLSTFRTNCLPSNQMADQRQKIIASVFSRRNASGNLEETYVSHVKIWEDAEGGRKPRYILLSRGLQ